MVAIILVNYNGSDDTIECISSLARCVKQDFFIVVVDNSSTDTSVKKLKEAQSIYKFELLVALDNKGFSAGNNIGIMYALEQKAEYILLLNNDTIVSPDFLDYLLEGFKEFPNCGATIGKILYENQRNKIWYAGGALNHKTARTEHFNYGKDNLNKNEALVKVTFATGCCLCLSSESVNKVGLLCEDYFLYEEDTDYSLRLTERGYDIIYVPKAIIYHKVSASVGECSPMAQYYITRNKYTLIRKHFMGINKVTAYLYSTFQFLNRCRKKEMNIKYCIAGFRAFLKLETGKRAKAI